MRKLFVLFFVWLSIFMMEDTYGQLTIDEGNINARYVGFKRNCGWGNGTHKWLLIRTQAGGLGGTYYCFRKKKPTQYQYYTLNDNAGSFHFTSADELFPLTFIGAWGNEGQTDGDNCNDGVTDGGLSSKIFNSSIPISSLNFNASNFCC